MNQIKPKKFSVMNFLQSWTWCPCPIFAISKHGKEYKDTTDADPWHTLLVVGNTYSLTPSRDPELTPSHPPAVTRITTGSCFSPAWHVLEIFRGRSDEMSWPLSLQPPRELQSCWSSGINLTPVCFEKTKSAPQERHSLSKRLDGVGLEIRTEGIRFGISLRVVIKGFGSLKWGSLLL